MRFETKNVHASRDWLGATSHVLPRATHKDQPFIRGESYCTC